MPWVFVPDDCAPGHGSRRGRMTFEKRRFMQRILLHLCLVTCFQLVCLPASARDSVLQMTLDYETYFRQLVTDRNYPGAAFAIRQPRQDSAYRNRGTHDRGRTTSH